MDWQPIETAPTDPMGELRVMTFDPTQGNKAVAVQIADGDWWRSNAKSCGHWAAPTHWMPLPPPPTSAAKPR